MPKYRVLVYGSMDGLLFSDLFVTFSSGYAVPLRVSQGEYIPLEALDPMDVKKSLLAGSLGRAIAAGAVAVEEDAFTIPQTSPPSPQLPVVKGTTPPKNISVEAPAVGEKTPEITSPPAPKVEEQLTNLAMVKSPDDFFKLNYFSKLRLIRECSDRTFLQGVLAKTDATSKQLQNNLQLRISQLP